MFFCVKKIMIKDNKSIDINKEGALTGHPPVNSDMTAFLLVFIHGLSFFDKC